MYYWEQLFYSALKSNVLRRLLSRSAHISLISITSSGWEMLGTFQLDRTLKFWFLLNAV